MGLKDTTRELKRKESGEERKQFIVGKNAILIILFTIFFIFIFFSSYKIFFEKEGSDEKVIKKYTRLTDAEVLRICSQEEITKDFVAKNAKYSSKISLLTLENLTPLSIKYPAIYADLPKKDLYKVEYFGDKEGILLIIDPDKKEVLKYYRVKTLWFP